MSLKRYIGDGVYLDYDGFAWVLTTENGFDTTNRIVLEPVVYAALTTEIESMRKQLSHCEDEGIEPDYHHADGGVP